MSFHGIIKHARDWDGIKFKLLIPISGVAFGSRDVGNVRIALQAKEGPSDFVSLKR